MCIRDSLYEREEAEGDGAGRFRVFTMEEENLQCHQLLLGHSSVFSITRGGELELRFYEKKGVPLDNSFMDLLDDRENVIFEYSDVYKRQVQRKRGGLAVRTV